MFANQKTSVDIMKSIAASKDILLKDINLGLRITDEKGKVYRTTLSKWSKDEITFLAPLEQRDWVMFPIPITVEVCFVSSKSIYLSSLQIHTRTQQKDRILYKGTIVEPLVKKQQRAHFRLSTLCDLQYSIVPDDFNEEFIEAGELTYCKGTTVDISCGGMRMVGEHLFKSNQILYISLPFLHHEFFLKGKVLIPGDRNPNNTYTHRVQFVDMDFKTEELLSRLIFEKQRLLMKTSRNTLYR